MYTYMYICIPQRDVYHIIKGKTNGFRCQIVENSLYYCHESFSLFFFFLTLSFLSFIITYTYYLYNIYVLYVDRLFI